MHILLRKRNYKCSSSLSSRLLFFLLAIIMNLAFNFIQSSVAYTAEFKISPFVSISEEFTDNVHESLTDKQSDFILRWQPGVSLACLAPRFNFDVGYNIDYRDYSRNTINDNITHNAKLIGSLTIIENLFFVDLADTYQLIPLDIRRNTQDESLERDQEEQNLAQVMAYFLLHPGNTISFKIGYRFNDIRYFGSEGIDKSENGLFSDVIYELAPKYSLLGGYSYAIIETYFNDIQRHEVNAGFRLTYDTKSFLEARGGIINQKFEHETNVTDPFWLILINHETAFATVVAESAVKSTEDPLRDSIREVRHSARLVRNLQRGIISFGGSYSDYYQTSTRKRDRRKAGIAGKINYDLYDRMSATISGSIDRNSTESLSEYQYRVMINPGIALKLNYDITLVATYTYVSHLHSLRNSVDATNIQRAIVEIKKVF